MNNNFLVFIIFFLAKINTTLALDAHVHGEVKIDIAVDKDQVLLMVKSPADSFLGFEYRPKNKEELQKVASVKKILTKDIFKLFKKSKLGQCKITSNDWAHTFTGKNHSTIYSETYLKCDGQVKGTELRLAIFELFPRVKKVHLNLINDSSSVNKKIKNSDDIITL